MEKKQIPYQNTYVQYNNQEEIDRLDMNVWRSPYGSVPDGKTNRHLYRSAPDYSDIYGPLCGHDPEIQYITGRSGRGELPDHSSRFGYTSCPNGYCLGHFPGKYVVSNYCCDEPQPEGMAPKRFYDEFYQNKFTVESQAIVDYNFMKNYGMNLL